MYSRREFCSVSLAPFLAAPKGFDLISIERARVLKAGDAYLKEAPITVTAASSSRSAGGKHDYFSEGDYWWPDPKNPNGPYIQRDGMSNPDNFNDHRHALLRLSLQVPALAAAYRITKDQRYAGHAAKHLRAWFLDEATLMNPNLQYAQAIKGKATGRGTGIIDTIHLVEVVRAIPAIEAVLSKSDQAGLKQWFAAYLTWMTTHQYGKEERDAKNNHGTCWVMQVAEFARFTGNRELTVFCADRYKNVLLPYQMAPDGSFPLELKRTKPYGYSLFNLDAMATVCQILGLWDFELPDGRGMAKGVAFMFPYVKDKKSWPHPPDVMYFDVWPVRHPSLLFAGVALSKPEYLELWRTLNPDPTAEEGIRNYPIRQPVLWMS